LAAGDTNLQLQSTNLITTLTAGSNTFTLKYRAVGGGTATFSNRVIWAWALPST